MECLEKVTTYTKYSTAGQAASRKEALFPASNRTQCGIAAAPPRVSTQTCFQTCSPPTLQTLSYCSGQCLASCIKLFDPRAALPYSPRFGSPGADLSCLAHSLRQTPPEAQEARPPIKH